MVIAMLWLLYDGVVGIRCAFAERGVSGDEMGAKSCGFECEEGVVGIVNMMSDQ